MHRQPKQAQRKLVITLLDWCGGQNIHPILELARTLGEAGHTCRVCTVPELQYVTKSLAWLMLHALARTDTPVLLVPVSSMPVAGAWWRLRT